MAAQKKKRTPKNDEGRMSLGEHLAELRNRLVITAATVVVFAIAGWWLYYPVFGLLERPFKQLQGLGYNVQINIGGVAGSFETHLRVAAYIGVALAIPMMVYQAWAFITPGLHRKERQYGLGFLLTSFPLFACGLVFGYFAIIRAVPILMTFGPNKEVYQLVEFQSFIELVMKTCMVFGVAFIFPVFLVGLNLVGILPVAKMIKGWRWAILLSFIFTAIMVPTPEPLTLILVTSPFVALFFAAVGVSYVLEKRRNRRIAQERSSLGLSSNDEGGYSPAPIELPKTIEDHYSGETQADDT